MDILLDRRSLVTLACHFQQTSRSLHRALGGNWADFRAYYDAERRAAVQAELEKLKRLLPTGSLAQPPLDRTEICRTAPKLGFFRVVFGPWIARFKTHWRFRAEQVHFLASHLAMFLQVLDAIDKPDADVLIELRMNLSVCRCVVEFRAYGTPDFKRINDVEHFDRTESLPALKIEEVVGGMGPAAARPRSGARV